MCLVERDKSNKQVNEQMVHKSVIDAFARIEKLIKPLVAGRFYRVQRFFFGGTLVLFPRTSCPSDTMDTVDKYAVIFKVTFVLHNELKVGVEQ